MLQEVLYLLSSFTLLLFYITLLSSPTAVGKELPEQLLPPKSAFWVGQNHVLN